MGFDFLPISTANRGSTISTSSMYFSEPPRTLANAPKASFESPKAELIRRDPEPAASAGPPRLKLLTAAAVCAFWLGYQIFWYSVTIVIIPNHVASIAGDDNKGTALALVSGVSGAVNLLVAVYWGAINDLMKGWPRLGRRRPWIAIGAVVQAVVLFSLNPNMSLWLYTILVTVLIIASVIPSSAWYGLIADITPNSQFMLMSSYQGAFGVLGNLLGAVIGSFYSDLGPTYYIVANMGISIICSLITCFSPVVEPPVHVKENVWDVIRSPRKLWKEMVVDATEPLRKSRAFLMVFVSRFFFQLGINTIIQMFNYWLLDCVVIPDGLDPVNAVSVALLPLLLVAPIAAAIVTLKPFKNERKRIVYVTGFLFIAGDIAINFIGSFSGALAIAALLGLGYGPFISVEFAMVLDVVGKDAADAAAARLASAEGEDSWDVDRSAGIPMSATTYARDLSLWHNALVLPTLFAAPLAGSMRDHFQMVGKDIGVQCFGYKTIWMLVAFETLLGIIATYFIPNMN